MLSTSTIKKFYMNTLNTTTPTLLDDKQTAATELVAVLVDPTHERHQLLAPGWYADVSRRIYGRAVWQVARVFQG